MLQGNGLL